MADAVKTELPKETFGVFDLDAECVIFRDSPEECAAADIGVRTVGRYRLVEILEVEMKQEVRSRSILV